MQLRELRHQGHLIWPPHWHKSTDTAPTVTGEVGILRFVYTQEVEPTKCYLVMEHQAHTYIGELEFDDSDICRRTVAVLSNNIGSTVKEVGDRDIA